MEACVNGTLDKIELEFEDNAAVCVVLASEGYPVKYEKGIPMYGFETLKVKMDIIVSMPEPNSRMDRLLQMAAVYLELQQKERL